MPGKSARLLPNNYAEVDNDDGTVTPLRFERVDGNWLVFRPVSAVAPIQEDKKGDSNA